MLTSLLAHILRPDTDTGRLVALHQVRQALLAPPTDPRETPGILIATRAMLNGHTQRSASQLGGVTPQVLSRALRRRLAPLLDHASTNHRQGDTPNTPNETVRG